ncbi:ATP-binding protein [Pseudalkalibacillus sp. Hm43]|uniref:ATP-binding protein n=1 Tax=Pseudalkalibacillus sp. Hm43 TaxID=3450742 RepID=UPI003F4216AF
MRNAVIQPITSEQFLIFTSDNSGGIGEKDNDEVKVPYDILAYYSFRVAVMECLAAGGEPTSIILHNFNGEGHWHSLMKGIHKGLEELEMRHINVSGSSESNFSMVQSAIGIAVAGKAKHVKRSMPSFRPEFGWAVIGKPLVGQGVMDHSSFVIPLEMFKSLSALEDVYLWPVGSKGIQAELEQIFHKDFKVNSELDLHASAGPSTCTIVSYPINHEEEIHSKCRELFYPLEMIDRIKG